MSDPSRPCVRPAGSADEEAVFELAALMAVSFTVDRDAFRSSFETLVHSPDAHGLVGDVDGQVGGYLLGFTHPTFFANGPAPSTRRWASTGGRRTSGRSCRDGLS